MQPANYSERILLVVTGLSPQILTETLWALLMDQKPAFVPTRIKLLTTAKGERNVRLDLLESGQFSGFCREYGLDESVFSPDDIHIITDVNGRQLEDIRTPAENEAAADQITALIQQLTRQEDSALHVSMAGGRKTMGYYAGYALSLFARPQDRLSHVLVSSEYEGLEGFYYPTRKSHLIKGRDRQAVDARDAKVTLAKIPFVRLRDEVPEDLLGGTASFSQAIEKAQRINQPMRLQLKTGQGELWIAGEQVKLPPLNLAFYWWLVLRLVEGRPPVAKRDLLEPNVALASEFMQVFERLVGEMGKDIDRTRDALRQGMDDVWFTEKVTQIKKYLNNQLGKTVGSKYLVANIGAYGSAQYSINVPAECIDIDGQQPLITS